MERALDRFAPHLRLLAADPAGLNRDQRSNALQAAAELRAWTDAREAAVVAECAAADDATASGATGVAELVKRAGSVAGQAAARRVRAADALAAVPIASAALADGEISHDHAAVLGALWADLDTAARDRLVADSPELVDHARSCTPETFRNRLGAWRREVDPAGAEAAAEKRRQRAKVGRGVDDDGMGWLHAHLAAEDHATLTTVLDGLVDDLWRAENATAADSDAPPDSVRTNTQRRAAALVEMARRAQGATAADGRRARPTLYATIDLQTLLDRLHANSTCTLSDGTPLTPAAARRLACEADIIPVVLGGDGRPLDVGHKHRLATPAQRDALRIQYGGCCGIAGCDVPFDYCAVHHITAWEDFGPTDLHNLVPLCSRHHHFVHDHGWSLRQRGVDAYTLDPPHLRGATAA